MPTDCWTMLSLPIAMMPTAISPARRARSDNAQTSYTFNAFGQLTGINGPNGLVVGYRYDAVGRRIEKNVGGQITRYIYDGAHIRLELNGSNQLAARFTHGNGVDEILAMERGGAIYYYLTDRLGSVRKLVNAAGATVNSYEYDSYGRRTAAQETVANPFSYTGQDYDAESGLYFYRRATTIHRQGALSAKTRLGWRVAIPISIPMCATIQQIPSIHQGTSASGTCLMWSRLA